MFNLTSLKSELSLYPPIVLSNRCALVTDAICFARFKLTVSDSNAMACPVKESVSVRSKKMPSLSMYDCKAPLG